VRVLQLSPHILYDLTLKHAHLPSVQSETSGQISNSEIQTPPTYCPHQYRSAAQMMSTFETSTRTLRYKLRSRGIYTEERTLITSPETLSEPPPKTQDESMNTVQETPNSQFRLLLSVTPCMPCIDSKKSVNCSPSPPLVSTPIHIHDSLQNQSPSPPLSPTTSLTSTYNNSPELFSPTLLSRLVCPAQVVQNQLAAAPLPPQV